MLEIIFTAEDFYIDRTDKADKDSEPSTVHAVQEDVQTKWRDLFTENKFKALYELGFDAELKTADKTPSFNFLYFLAERFIDFITNIPEIELIRGKLQPQLPEDIKSSLLSSVPFAIGSEYINEVWLQNIFSHLTDIFNQEISSYDGQVSKYFSDKRQDLKIPERVFFHLVENKKDSLYPFAFLATYSTNRNGKVKHMPLSYSLKEFKKDNQKLLSLLSCLNRVAEISPLISSFIESGEMLHPLRLTSDEAYEILKAIPALEETGILCRIPNWWKQCH